MGDLLLSVQDLLTVFVVLLAVLAVGAVIVDRRPGLELWTAEDAQADEDRATLARWRLAVWKRERARAVRNYAVQDMPAWMRDQTVVRIKRRPPAMANRSADRLTALGNVREEKP